MPDDDRSDLPDLVGFGQLPDGLDIDDFIDPVPRKDVMAPPDAFLKTQTQQHVAEVIEVEVAFAEPRVNPLPQLVESGHVANLHVDDKPADGGASLVLLDAAVSHRQRLW
jgi:hypothetical protein